MNGMHQWWSEVGDSRNVIVGATKLKKRELIASESSEFSLSPDFCVNDRGLHSTILNVGFVWLEKTHDQ